MRGAAGIACVSRRRYRNRFAAGGAAELNQHQRQHHDAAAAALQRQLPAPELFANSATAAATSPRRGSDAWRRQLPLPPSPNSSLFQQNLPVFLQVFGQEEVLNLARQKTVRIRWDKVGFFSPAKSTCRMSSQYGFLTNTFPCSALASLSTRRFQLASACGTQTFHLLKLEPSVATQRKDIVCRSAAAY